MHLPLDQLLQAAAFHQTADAGFVSATFAGFGIYKRFRRYHNNNPRNLVSYTLTQVFFHFVPESRLFETDVLPISSKKA